MPPLSGLFDAPGQPGLNDLPPMFPPPDAGPGRPVALPPGSVGGPPAPAAQPSQPGLLSRLAAGFGTPRMDPLAAEWMTPEQQSYLQSRGQAGMAAALMQAGGPRPQGTSNFFSRVGEGLGAGMANWQEIQANATQRAMQSLQFGWQVQARDMLAQALKENPDAGPDASPADKAARLSKIASRLAMAGPLGAEYAKQYGELARMILEGSPLSAEQQNKIWTDAIGPSERAAHAWDQYKGLSGKYDRIAIAQRAQLADQIMDPDKPAQVLGAYQNADVLEKIPGVGPILAAAFRIGKINPDDAAYLDKYVEAGAKKGRAQAEHILDHQRLIGQHGALGADWKGYYNPFDGDTGPRTVTPAVAPPADGVSTPYRVILRGGKLVKVPK